MVARGDASGLIAYGEADAAKAKVDGKKFAAFESKLATRRRSTDTHFDEVANAVQDKISSPPMVATDERTLQTPPFAHPYYWGGFVYTGL
jgi:CHAT domain-containing protein